jgi:predicted ester cyclase
MKEMKEVVRNFSRAFATNDVKTLVNLCTEYVTVTDPAGTLKGPEGIKLWRRWVSNHFPQLTLITTNLIGEKNWVVKQGIIKGTTPQGISVSFPNTVIFEFKDNKIERITELYDVLTIADQTTKGWLTKRAVNTIINQYKTELRTPRNLS